MSIFNFSFKRKPIGITCTYDADDARLKTKEEIHCQYVGHDGSMKHKTVSVTLAEKQVIECIAMRLFLDHKRVVKKDRKSVLGKVKLTGVVLVDYLEK